MRDIKFRALDIYDKSWVYSETDGEAAFFYGIEDGQYDRNTLGQFTGLHDKNGKEIYEGDIIENVDENECYKGERGVIEYHYYEFEPNRQKIHNEKREFVEWWGDWYNIDRVTMTASCIIIGNIYENKELLNDTTTH